MTHMSAPVHKCVNTSANVTYTTLRTAFVTNLAEGEANAAPAPEDVVSSRTFLHARIPMLEVPAGHTATCITWFGAATQALVMAALALEAACTMLTVVHAH